MTGEGHHLLNSAIPKIPVYKPDPENRFNPAQSKVVDHMLVDIGINSECAFGIIAPDNSMAPRIPQGAYALFGKQVEEPLYGQVYFVVTHRYNLIRIVRKGSTERVLRLAPQSTQEYDEIEWRVKEIERLYPLNIVIWNGKI